MEVIYDSLLTSCGPTQSFDPTHQVLIVKVVFIDGGQQKLRGSILLLNRKKRTNMEE